MACLFTISNSKESPLFKFFCSMISEALYVVREGEIERVTKWLKEVRKMSEEDIGRLPRRYWRKRCRNTILAPDIIIQRLDLVYSFFVTMPEPTDPDRRFFNATFEYRWKVSM